MLALLAVYKAAIAAVEGGGCREASALFHSPDLSLLTRVRVNKTNETDETNEKGFRHHLEDSSLLTPHF